jgi:hypothetical protein
MVGVASQIVFCIFAAAVIGSVAGYLVNHVRQNARIADVEKLWKAKVDQRDGEIAALREGGASMLPSHDMQGNNGVAAPAEFAASPSDPSQFESKLTQALSLIEKLARSQERMEGELNALRSGRDSDFKLEPSAPKS